MKYQLVLQWSASELPDYDDMIEIEDLLIANLSEGSEVDGHDAGAGEVNIFVRTDRPEATFEEVKTTLQEPLWTGMRAAYREFASNTYAVLWPKNLTEFRVA